MDKRTHPPLSPPVLKLSVVFNSFCTNVAALSPLATSQLTNFHFNL